MREHGADWPRYESHKIVQAAKIVRISDAGAADDLYLVVSPDGVAEEPFHTTEPAMMKRAEVGGYAVIYQPDEKHSQGYRSVSPAKAFEDGYTRVAP